MGNLTKRFKDDGSVVYYADYVDIRTGKRVQKSLRTSDPKVAKLRLRDLELATTDSAPHATETLDAALKYFVDVVHATSPAATVTCYRQKARHLATAMGATLVSELTAEMVERYIAKRCGNGPDSDKAHRHSVHKELIVLRGALKSARKRGTFRGNVADIVPSFASGYTPRETFLTPDQFMLLAQNLIVRRPNAKPETREHERVRLINRTLYLLLSGLVACRRGELEKLEWTHVDLERNMITVPKSKVRVGGKPYRTVPIHPRLRPWLVQLQQPQGRIVEPWGSVGRDLPEACERAGVPRVTLNDLRRTFASWSVQAGVPAKVVANLMGHTSTRMVDLVYGRVGPNDYELAIAKLPGAQVPDDRSHAGYTNEAPKPGIDGTSGTAALVPYSAELFVPSPGIEPGTRGFSVRCSTI